MMRVVFVAVVALFVLILGVSAQQDVRVEMEGGFATAESRGWTRTAAANDDAVLTFRLLFRLRNQAAFDALFNRITDPTSPVYGKYLSLEQLSKLVDPLPESVDEVTQWLNEQGIVVVSSTVDSVEAQASVATWSRALRTSFSSFAHADSAHPLIKAHTSYSLPAPIARHIHLVAGVAGLHTPRTQRTLQATADPEIGPADLRKRYNVTTIGQHPKNSYAVAEFQNQYYSPSDLTSFFQQFVPYAKNNQPVTVVGKNDPNQPGTEAELDIQYIMGVAPNISSTFYSVPGMDFWADLTTWTYELGNDSSVPLVISVSYGDQRESQPSVTYKDAISAQFQKLGARGVSVIFASGDSGTGCDFCWEFQASFPATSPYVTSVGATRFLNGAVGPEGAVTAFSSGGGFSKVFSQPSYQSAAVQHYLSTATDLPAQHYFNASGRGTPDVAALGIGFSVVQGGRTISVGGTSASAPTFAAVVSLLNDLRLQANKAPLGFLNPWIYQTAAKNPSAFYDVTEGTNHYSCCLKGFPCSAGWDPVTGVGTPNFEVLKTLI